MTARDRVDAEVRRLARVTDDHVARAAGAEAREGLLEGIVDMPDPTTTTARGRRRLRRPAVLAGMTAATLGAGAAIGWAIVSSSARDTTSVECDIEGSSSIIPSVSGDPVADCAAEWRRIGRAAPPLVAYDNGHGGVTVADASRPLPEGATPLAPGAGQNVALIELQESLDDWVAGLASSCHGEADAAALARRQLARLGLADWAVRYSPRDGTCVDSAVVDPATRTVTLMPLGGPAEPASRPSLLAARLREVAAECLPLDAAAARVRAVAAELGMSESARDYQLTAVPAAGSCTAIRQTVGGTVFLTLRGPRG